LWDQELLGAWDKSPVTIFAPPLSDHFTSFSVKYRPVFALKTHKMYEKIRHKSDNGLLSQAPREEYSKFITIKKDKTLLFEKVVYL